MRKALKLAFSRASTAVCSLHLHKNTDRFLVVKCTSNSKERSALIQAIFEKDDLTACADPVEFENEVEVFRKERLLDAPDNFRQ